ncbi:MAG: protein kinase [Gammaproteobacteria bacterium]|nr:protein kinase [Gammaproteobacteria bacterium]
MAVILTRMAEVPERLKAAVADRYRIERELGAGGMATVYLAEDLKHHRKVAVKVLRPELAAAIGPERFLREIEIAAGLTHPHILPLHDSGEVDGFLFYVMPYVEGESLRDRLVHEKQLAVDGAIEITEAVARALDYAHRQGVIHRDIKPENILLLDGVPLVADFGIAVAVSTAGGARLTETGLSLGTPAYMSPEQVAGERDLDGRSDIYALGCVTYEMLAGDPPFVASHAQAVMAKHVTDAPPPVATTRPSVSAAVAVAIAKALSKVPADRYATAGEFAAALFAPAEIVAEKKSIAVLPFANMSADPENEYFSDGITEDLIAQISKIRGLKVISRTSTMRYKSTGQTLRQIGEELGVSTILEGSVRRAGNRVRVVAQLIDAHTDEHLWTETYDRELTDVFAIQSDVALEVATALETALSPAERGRVEKRPTANMEAYDLCLLGRHQANRRTDEGLRRAIKYFERALEKDPNYAVALAGLADAYVLSAIGYQAVPPPDAMRRAKKAALQAIELEDTLPEAHASLGYQYLMEWDWSRARQEFERAIALNPSYAQAHQWYHHCLVGLSDLHAALEEATRARELDPLSVLLTNELGWPYLYLGQFQRAREQFLKALEMDPEFAMAHFNLANTYECEGRYDEAIPVYEKAVELSGRMPFITAFLGGAYARLNRVDEARAIWRELFEKAQKDPNLQMWVAHVHEALGETEKALECLEQAYEARSPFLQLIGSEWLRFESVRDHPRFTALRDKMGLSGDAVLSQSR